jgi:hypothetical protein
MNEINKTAQELTREFNKDTEAPPKKKKQQMKIRNS